ncbi:hypothetical protein B0H16DRAFT_1895232 [Mycena metata]|uniref:Chromatin target of PRMT1 protein C-terminal domain-containing protein n=1 Tax=Mycena metata TaxID=1033252 RepID=A0AAD7MPB7_9AGAR|nr:hypothetical protein B0H16DRAFT_1895232 [Mycena metata]
MDTFPADGAPDAFPDLSYDDTAYEEQLPTPAEQAASLANRISSNKVYLLSESTRVGGKRKHGEEDAMDEEDVDMDEDTTYRGNALLLHGSPISSLPTAGLFAYATHFEAHPLGLEWVDDERCVFVFNSKAEARAAHRSLQKHISEEPDAEGYITAKPIPVAIWPPEERINKSLGKGDGLKGTIRMRWARTDDVKKRGAKKDSQFYRKHGWTAGKEKFDEGSAPAPAAKRRRRGSPGQDDEQERAALDAELDAFIRADDEPEPELELEPEVPSSPVSKMRSDYILNDGRTLLQRTSVMRARPDTLEARLTAPLPRRVKTRGTMYADSIGGTMYADNLEDTRTDDRLEWGRDTTQWGRERESEREREREPRRNGGGVGRSNGARRENGRRNGGRGGERRGRNERPTLTAEDLDAELDAFLEDKD